MTNNVHAMADIETWSSAKNAMIISIGAVKFDPNGGDILDRFHVGVDPTLMSTKGFDISAQTLLWWMHPDRDEPRRRWIDMRKMDLATVLVGFSEWYGTDPNVPVWGNGAAFDNVILRSAYETLNMECPWGFRSDRCYRTMKNLLPHIKEPSRLPNQGVTHDALYDAEWQARHLQAIYAHLEDVAAG